MRNQTILGIVLFIIMAFIAMIAGLHVGYESKHLTPEPTCIVYPSVQAGNYVQLPHTVCFSPSP